MKAIAYVVAILILGGAAYFTLEHSRKFGELEKVRLETIATNKAVSANADAKEADLRKAKEKACRRPSRSREELTQALDSLKSTVAAMATTRPPISTARSRAQEAEFAELNKTLEEVAADPQGTRRGHHPRKPAREDPAARRRRQSPQGKTRGTRNPRRRPPRKSLATKRDEIDRLVQTRNRAQRPHRTQLDGSRGHRRQSGLGIPRHRCRFEFRIHPANPHARAARRTHDRHASRPSAIEPTQTIAEIDFKSMATGARIQPGDRVILAKPAAN